MRYNLYSVSSLSDLFPAINWNTYMEAFFPAETFSSVVNASSNVIVTVPTFQGNLSTIISETNPDTLVYYTYWSIIQSFGKSIPKNGTEILDVLSEKLGNRAKQEPPRYETCISKTDDVIGEVAGKWYVNKVFAGESKQAAEHMIEMVKESFMSRLPTIEWIDEETRIKAIEKVKQKKTRVLWWGLPKNYFLLFVLF